MEGPSRLQNRGGRKQAHKKLSKENAIKKKRNAWPEGKEIAKSKEKFPTPLGENIAGAESAIRRTFKFAMIKFFNRGEKKLGRTGKSYIRTQLPRWTRGEGKTGLVNSGVGRGHHAPRKLIIIRAKKGAPGGSQSCNRADSF